MADNYLIVGLGNPGRDYEYSRHNLGFLVIQTLAEKNGLKLKSSPICKGLVTESKIANEDCLFLLPLTFMNSSGLAVKQMVDNKKISLNNLLIVCDDLNLRFGDMRIRRKGSDGGHNGLKSIIYHLGSIEFPRLRIGINDGSENKKKTAQEKDGTIEFVLDEFTKKERKQLGKIISDAIECCNQWVQNDIENVMNQYNLKKGKA